MSAVAFLIAFLPGLTAIVFSFVYLKINKSLEYVFFVLPILLFLVPSAIYYLEIILAEFMNYHTIYFYAINPALVEEGIRVLALYLIFRNHKNWHVDDFIFTGVLVSFVISGFENVLYLANPGNVTSINLALQRSLSATFLHLSLGAIEGYFLGLFFQSRNRLYLIILLTPFLIHGIYDWHIYLLHKNQNTIWFTIVFALFLTKYFKEIIKHYRSQVLVL